MQYSHGWRCLASELLDLLLAAYGGGDDGGGGDGNAGWILYYGLSMSLSRNAHNL